MAIVPSNLYAGRIIDGDAGYPYGKALDIQGGVVGTGTPVRATWLNDVFGFQQALLAEVGFFPSGIADAVGSSQYLNAIKQLINNSSTGLQSNIDSEAATRLANDNTLQSNIDTEESSRVAADNTLQGNITSEAATRLAADNTLQGNIDTEETNRIAADDAITTELNKLATETQVGRVEKATSAEALSGTADKFMDAALTKETLHEYGLEEVKLLSTGDALDTTLPVGFYTLSGAVTNLPAGVTSATGVSINDTSEGMVLLADTSAEEVYVNWQVSETYSTFAKLKHSKNTNSNVFLAEAIGDVLGDGYGDSIITGKIYLPLDSYSSPTGITLNGTFDVKSVDGSTTFATGITTLTLDSSSSPKRAVINVTGLVGVAIDQPIVLHSVEVDSSVTVNF